VYQFFAILPYYNSVVSETFGAMLGVYCWISLNAFLMKIYEMSGHLIVIAIGAPIVVVVMKRLRSYKIEWLMSTNAEKFTKDVESLN
jgi:hypothetical protein